MKGGEKLVDHHRKCVGCITRLSGKDGEEKGIKDKKHTVIQWKHTKEQNRDRQDRNGYKLST